MRKARTAPPASPWRRLQRARTRAHEAARDTRYREPNRRRRRFRRRVISATQLPAVHAALQADIVRGRRRQVRLRRERYLGPRLSIMHQRHAERHAERHDDRVEQHRTGGGGAIRRCRRHKQERSRTTKGTRSGEPVSDRAIDAERQTHDALLTRERSSPHRRPLPAFVRYQPRIARADGRSRWRRPR